MDASRQRYLFVTGKLAARALTDVLKAMDPDFEYEISVLNSSVAALMNLHWIGERLEGAERFDTVVVPGRCHGEIDVLARHLGTKVVRGPEDLNDLPAFFGMAGTKPDLSEYHTKILSEIVDAYTIGTEAIVARAFYYRENGADVIDLGCPPSGGFPGVGEAVTALKSRGFMVSVDTFDPDTIREADRAGVDMLLSVNSSNIEVARDIRAKVVVIPDFGKGVESMERSAAQLVEWGVPHVLDPILDPIGFGLADSIARYSAIREKYPEAEMLMGLGNLTELTHADTTGINAVMAGIMAEQSIDFVLTTEVSPHATGVIREFDRARRMMHYSVNNHVLPVNLTDDLLTIKDAVRPEFSDEELAAIHADVKDRNFRIFVSGGAVVVFNREVFLRGTDTQKLFDQMGVQDPSHAYYIGRELERAVTAARLGKRYVQDNPIHYGYLSGPSRS
ncbi:PTS mannitol transporter subunit IIABC [Pseudodesulfovibrio sp. JC047]|uniref:DUF6513 domain-containing protein n=1 Tax=Pseudodesulfovibrio sp. JC047 TaxID=2683199 RepID=UPI0013D51549|nr:DUF6513 domain-containing protein [Pseudodesulfovibrio sp. JC047]NDV19449.1 PTS mannitol transporter subunit IIABC [Pseudodesulfovibrio sp. JC047]